MRVRHLQSCLTDKGLLRQSKISYLKGMRVGIDALYWIRALSCLKDPLADPTGGPPASLYTVLDLQLRRFSEIGIQPVFIFQGMQPKSHMLFASQLHEEMDQAWALLAAEKYEQANQKFSEATSRVNSDIVWCIFHYLKAKGIEIFQAPYFATAQIASFVNQNFFGAVIGHPALMLFGVPRIIVSMDFKNQNFLWVDKPALMETWKITKEQFVHACLLAGTEYCLTFPYLNLIQFQSGRQFTFLTAVEFINQAHILQYMMHFPNDEMRDSHVDGYCVCKMLIQHPIVISNDGTVGPKEEIRDAALVEEQNASPPCGAQSNKTSRTCVPGEPPNECVAKLSSSDDTRKGSTAVCLDADAAADHEVTKREVQLTEQSSFASSMRAKTDSGELDGCAWADNSEVNDHSRKTKHEKENSANQTSPLQEQKETSTSKEPSGEASPADRDKEAPTSSSISSAAVSQKTPPTSKSNVTGGEARTHSSPHTADECSATAVDSQTQLPTDFSKIVGIRLPASVYYLMAEGVLSRKIPSVLAFGEWLDYSHPTVDTMEYRQLLNDIGPYRCRALGLISTQVHPSIRSRSVTFSRYTCEVSSGEVSSVEIARRSPIVSEGLSWSFTLDELYAEMKRQNVKRINLKFCLKWHAHAHKQGIQLFSQTSGSEPQCGDSLDGILALVHLRLLETLGYFGKSGGTTLFGLLLAQSPSKFEEGALVALELMSFGMLKGEAFEGPPDRPLSDAVKIFRRDYHSAGDKQSILLLSRVMSLIPMKLRMDRSWESDVDYDLAAFHSIVRILRRTLRQLSQCCLSSIMLLDLDRVKLLPPGLMNPEDPLIPCFIASRNCMGVVAKLFLEYDPDLDRTPPTCATELDDDFNPSHALTSNCSINDTPSRIPTSTNQTPFSTSLPFVSANSSGAPTPTAVSSHATRQSSNVNASPRSDTSTAAAAATSETQKPQRLAAGGSLTKEASEKNENSLGDSDVQPQGKRALESGASIDNDIQSKAKTEQPQSKTSLTSSSDNSTAQQVPGITRSSDANVASSSSAVVSVVGEVAEKTFDAVADERDVEASLLTRRFEEELRNRFVCCVNPMRDLIKAFAFWNDSIRIVDQLGDAVKSSPLKAQMSSANKLLWSRIKKFNLQEHPEWRRRFRTEDVFTSPQG